MVQQSECAVMQGGSLSGRFMRVVGDQVDVRSIRVGESRLERYRRVDGTGLFKFVGFVEQSNK